MGCIYFDVGYRMKVTQLARLRASGRYGRTLRNTVEVHYICFFIIDYKTFVPYPTTDLEKSNIFQRLVISMTPSYTANLT